MGRVLIKACSGPTTDFQIEGSSPSLKEMALIIEKLKKDSYCDANASQFHLNAVLGAYGYRMRDIETVSTDLSAAQTPFSSSTGRLAAGNKPTSTFENGITSNWLILIILLTVATAFLLRNLAKPAASKNREIASVHFEQSEQELADNRDNALWVKSLSLSDGNEQKARFQYIRIRAEELAQNYSGSYETPITVSHPISDISGEANVIAKYLQGGYGLSKSFWIGLVGGWFVLWAVRIIMTVTPQDKMINIAGKAGFYLVQIAPYRYFWLFFITYLLYATAASTAVFNAGKRFNGKPIWIDASRAFVVLFVIFSILIATGGYMNFMYPIS